MPLDANALRKLTPLLMFAGAMLLYALWTYRRARSIMRQWLADRGMDMLHASQGFLGPPLRLWNGSKEQYTFRIRAYDRNAHRIREGWMRVGGYWIGVLNPDAVEMYWDDERA